MERPGGRSGQISLNLQDLGLVQDYQPKSVNLWRVGIICQICCLCSVLLLLPSYSLVLMIGIRRIRMFLGLPDPDPLVWIWVRIWILPFSYKGVERTGNTKQRLKDIVPASKL